LVHNNRKELAIQEDETAIVIVMLGEYLKYSGDQHFVDSMYDKLVRPAAKFMSTFIDPETELPHASYDLWEEKFLISTYTAAVTYRALEVAAELARTKDIQTDADRWQQAADLLKKRAGAFYNAERGILNKGYLLTDNGFNVDSTLDISSFYGAFMFDYASVPEHLASTLQAIENNLLDISPSGGCARYEDDNYFKSNPAYRGNPWFVTTLWLAQYYALQGQTEKASKYIDWSLKNSLPSGLLSEQISPEDSKIVGVTPLVWSHAELINTILDVN
jgi:GH15 family glucan-1,4-alpha-glucosidase